MHYKEKYANYQNNSSLRPKLLNFRRFLKIRIPGESLVMTIFLVDSLAVIKSFDEQPSHGQMFRWMAYL